MMETPHEIPFDSFIYNITNVFPTLEQMYPILEVFSKEEGFISYKELENKYINEIIESFNKNTLPSHEAMRFGGSPLAYNRNYIFNAYKSHNLGLLNYLYNIYGVKMCSYDIFVELILNNNNNGKCGYRPITKILMWILEKNKNIHIRSKIYEKLDDLYKIFVDRYKLKSVNGWTYKQRMQTNIFSLVINDGLSDIRSSYENLIHVFKYRKKAFEIITGTSIEFYNEDHKLFINGGFKKYRKGYTRRYIKYKDFDIIYRICNRYHENNQYYEFISRNL